MSVATDSRLIEIPVYLGKNGGRQDYNSNLVTIGDGWVTGIDHPDNKTSLLWGIEDFNGWMRQGKGESTPKKFPFVIEGRKCNAYFKILYTTDSKPCLRATFEIFSSDATTLNITEELIKQYIEFFVVGDLEVDPDTKKIDWFQITGIGVNNKYTDTTDILFTMP